MIVPKDCQNAEEVYALYREIAARNRARDAAYAPAPPPPPPEPEPEPPPPPPEPEPPPVLPPVPFFLPSTVKHAIWLAATHLNVDPQRVRSAERTAPVAHARFIAMHL